MFRLFCALADSTDREAGALTVAGQWRIFTAFPSIRAIFDRWTTPHMGGAKMMSSNEFR